MSSSTIRSGLLGRREQAARVGDRGAVGRPDEALVADRRRPSRARRSAGRRAGATASARIDSSASERSAVEPSLGRAMASGVVRNGVRSAVALAPVERRVRVAIEQPPVGAGGGERRDPDRQREGLPRPGRVAAVQRAREDVAGGRETRARCRCRAGGSRTRRRRCGRPGRSGAGTARRSARGPLSSSSPAAWPRPSLIFLRSSTSTRRRASGVCWRAAWLIWRASSSWNARWLPRPVRPSISRVEAGLAVELEQPAALLLELVDVAKDRPREAGHRERDDDRADDEEADRRVGAGTAAGPEALDRRNGHEHGELDDEDRGSSALGWRRSGGRGSGGRGSGVWSGMVSDGGMD